MLGNACAVIIDKAAGIADMVLWGLSHDSEGEIEANLVLLQDARIETTDMSGLTKTVAGGKTKYTNSMPHSLQLPALGLT